MTNPTARFAYYEVVIVRTTPTTLKDEIAGKTGAVLGISLPKTEEGRVSYALGGYDFTDTCMVTESELTSTGRIDRREDFFSGESIRVSQEGEPLDE